MQALSRRPGRSSPCISLQLSPLDRLPIAHGILSSPPVLLVISTACALVIYFLRAAYTLWLTRRESQSRHTRATLRRNRACRQVLRILRVLRARERSETFLSQPAVQDSLSSSSTARSSTPKKSLRPFQATPGCSTDDSRAIVHREAQISHGRHLLPHRVRVARLQRRGFSSFVDCNQSGRLTSPTLEARRTQPHWTQGHGGENRLQGAVGGCHAPGS